jgi:hypothetical protein
MHLSDGAAFDVTHPELVLLGRRSLILGLAARPKDTLYERAIDVDLIHIVRMEQIEATAQRGDGNP